MSACVRTLPIRLEPLPGESFDGWLFAYAARLDTPLTEFAATTGLPRGFVRQTPRSIALGKSLNNSAGIARATGMDGDSVDRLWRPFASYAKAVRARFDPPGMLRPVVPMGWSRFCPACLSADGDRWKVAWRLVWHTTCDVHGCLLIDACPVCDRHQRENPFVASDVTLRPPCACSARSPIGTGRLGQACGHDLASAPAPADADVGRRTLAFQAAVAPALGADAGAAARRHALDVLADVLLIAAGLGGDAPLGVHPLAKPADMAQVLARAWDCYIGDAEVDMLRVVTGDTQIPGVLPRAWSVASQSLTARAILARDGSMAITDRLRWRSMTTPGRPRSRGLEVARRRSRYLPEALWADWAVRLTPTTGVDAKSFRVVAAAALLLPGTPRPLETVLRGTPHEGRGRKVFHVLAMVPPTDATAVLRALTEIADGLDSRGGVIDYQRRRELAASVELLGAVDWAGICGLAGIPKGGIRKLNNARLWLHETLTGSPLHSAPAPIRPDEQAVIAYHHFVVRLPARAARLLDERARDVLAAAGIDEPLTWSPPREWVKIERLPGPEPDEIDVERLQRLLRTRLPVGTVADSLGVSLDHLRLAVRLHPLEQQPRPVAAPKVRRWNCRPFPAALTPERLRHLVVDEGRGMRTIAAEYDVDRKTVRAVLIRENIPIGPPGARSRFVVDPEWLRAEYVDRRRTLPDIAQELGTTPPNVARMAVKYGIPLRSRGGSSHARNVAPVDDRVPLPLAAAIAGEGGPERVRRFQVVARSPSIRQAAMTMGLNEPAIYTQLVRLERACAGALLIRYTRTHQALTLTPLGKLLLDQADDHFGRAPSSPLEGLPEPLASAVVSLQGPARVRRFMTIAEADSLKHAARILGTHDSTISTQVRMLEARCGGLLLHRRTETATQRLTDLGRLLIEQARSHPEALAAGTVTP